MESTELEEVLKETIKEKGQRLKCPLCGSEGKAGDDFILNLKTYAFGCMNCGVWFTPIEILKGLKEIVLFRNSQSKEKKEN